MPLTTSGDTVNDQSRAIGNMKPIRVVPPEQWSTLPVQPTASYWWRIARFFGAGVFVAATILIIMAFASLADRSIALLVPPVLALILVQAFACIVICMIAAVPYRKERRLGYTTWPSSKELDRRP